MEETRIYPVQISTKHNSAKCNIYIKTNHRENNIRSYTYLLYSPRKKTFNTIDRNDARGTRPKHEISTAGCISNPLLSSLILNVIKQTLRKTIKFEIGYKLA